LATRKERMWQHIRADKVMRQVRKQAKHQHDEERVRRKEWQTADFDDLKSLDELDLPAQERVMPRGERDRRRSNLSAALAELVADPARSPMPATPAEAPGRQGVVVETASGLCRVDIGEQAILCTVRNSLKFAGSGQVKAVAVGDDVIVSLDGAERGMVEEVLPRRSALARPDPFYSHLAQVIVANVDQLLIVASWREPAFWPELTDRYLIAGIRNGLTPIICVNKTDLATDRVELERTLEPYRRAGYTTLCTSARTSAGLGELAALLQGKTTALAGLSGVGKSSLLAAVQPGLNLRIGDVSERRHEGRHTTTQVTLHRLDGGGFVVDTPGIREFGLAGLRRGELARFYPELATTAQGCRFEDCSHTREPGCAVKLAVREGRISAMRYDSYRKIYAALPL